MTIRRTTRQSAHTLPLPRKEPVPWRSRAFQLFKIVTVSVLVLVTVLPLAWLLLSSFKGAGEFALNPAYSLPESIQTSNYIDAWRGGRVGLYFRNTIVVVFPSLIAIVALSVAAAFALEVMRWKGMSVIILLFLGGIFVPLQMVLVPLFTMYFRLGLLDTPWSLIITYTAFSLPLSVFLIMSYFKAVPRDLMEAAVVDGANIYQAFFRVALPLVSNALVTVALVQFIWLWNDLLFALTFISSSENRTIQAGLLAFTDEWGRREWGPTFAGITITVIPALVFYAFLNKRIIKGLTQGAIKG